MGTVKHLFYWLVFFHWQLSAAGSVGLPVKHVTTVEVDGEETIIYLPIHSETTYRFLPRLKTSISRTEQNPSLGLDDNWVIYVAELSFGNFLTSRFKAENPAYQKYIFNVADVIASKNCNFSIRVDGDDINKKKIISVKRSAFDEKGRKFAGDGAVCSYYFALNKNVLGYRIDDYLEEIKAKASVNELIASPFAPLVFETTKNVNAAIDIGLTHQDLQRELRSFPVSDLPLAYFTFAYFAVNNRIDDALATDDVGEKTLLFKFVFDYLYERSGDEYQLIDGGQLRNPLDYEQSRKEKIELTL